MYATLYDFLRMTPEQQAHVTEIDLSIADPSDDYRRFPDPGRPRRERIGDFEEYLGEGHEPPEGHEGGGRPGHAGARGPARVGRWGPDRLGALRRELHAVVGGGPPHHVARVPVPAREDGDLLL